MELLNFKRIRYIVLCCYVYIVKNINKHDLNCNKSMKLPLSYQTYLAFNCNAIEIHTHDKVNSSLTILHILVLTTSENLLINGI